MQLVVFGTSLSYGHDHRDPPVDQATFNHRSWVRHVTESMDQFDSVDNRSNSGAGCETILWDLDQWIQSYDARTPAFVIIEWAPEVRHDYYDWDKECYSGGPTRVHVNHRWRAEHIILSAIKLMQDHHIPYCMTSSITNYMQDGHMITRTGSRNQHDTWTPITQGINWLMSDHMNCTLYDILTGSVDQQTHHTHKLEQEYFERMHRAHPHMITPCSHPTDEGHRVIAERLKPYIEQYVHGL